MTLGDGLGWAACLMTLITFAQRRMLPLRIAAILANVCFIGYASIGHYLPVLALHITLLPINTQRLLSIMVDRPGGRLASISNGVVQQGRAWVLGRHFRS